MTRQPNEVEVTQYLRPSGRKRLCFAPVGEDYVEKARAMCFSAEVLSTGTVAIYGRLIGQSDEAEICEIASNGPGNHDPSHVLRRIIDRLGGTNDQ